jgi:hypothetical protein
MYEKDTWEFYRDDKDLWHWVRYASEDNNVVGRSHMGFKDKKSCTLNAIRATYRG